MQALHWNALMHSWIGKNEQAQVLVDEQTYEQTLTQYLDQHGVQRHSWFALWCATEVIGQQHGISVLRQQRTVEALWQQQCALEAALQADLSFWVSLPAVQVQWTAGPPVPLW